jgi:hypothetical protein
MPAVVAPGEEVMAYCKACKKISTHAVVAVRGGRPQRVRCIKCEDAHLYRASAPTAKKKVTRALSGSRLPALEGSYDDMMKGRDASRALVYGMNFRYASADLIAHETFGLGLVTSVLFNHKIEVAFPAGTKTLVHEREP